MQLTKQGELSIMDFEDPGGFCVWFSYTTPIAFNYNDKLHCRENVWGNTTGKHMNTIQPDKSKRITGVEFETKLAELFVTSVKLEPLKDSEENETLIISY